MITDCVVATELFLITMGVEYSVSFLLNNNFEGNKIVLDMLTYLLLGYVLDLFKMGSNISLQRPIYSVSDLT